MDEHASNTDSSHDKRRPDQQYPIPTPMDLIFTQPLSCQSQSRVATLPTELRHQIYALVFPSSGPLCSALLQTAQFYLLDALPFLYSRALTAHPTLLTALPYHRTRDRPVPPPLAQRWCRCWMLEVRLDIDARWSPQDVQAAFDGAKGLRIEAGQAMFGGCGVGVLKAFEGVRGVGRAEVVGAGDYGLRLARRMEMPEGWEGDGLETPDEEETWVDR